MAHGLSYLDAVRLLGGSGPLAKAADNLLGGLLSVATAGGSDAALSLFDAKTEVVRLGGLVTARINDSVRGLGRYKRSERLEAAHAALVVAAFFEALDGLDEFSRDEQLTLAAGPSGAGWVDRLTGGDIPGPSAGRSYAALLGDLTTWYATRADRLAAHLDGLLVADRAAPVLAGLPHRATAIFDESHRRLAAEIPEFAIWTGRLDRRATAHGLERLEELLLRASSGHDPGRHRVALSRAYRAGLDSPLLGDDATLPTLGAAYLDPRFTAKVAGPGARPADDQWWDDGEVRDDLGDFLAAYLTTTPATEAPLLLLGQPGAGKSSLTRVLAARLPAGDFFVARVPLREVPAEAEIQDQVELAVRAEIGETVAWAELVRDAGEALPVILLDGFDELLQATGVHQSDYLQRVARFQEREARLGRPVAVLVTSRVAVADRARLPAGALALRLEPFSAAQIEAWLALWNTAAGRPALTAAQLPDLAAQPLLLLMLALYHAAGHPLSADIDPGHLYERLLGSFAEREVRRLHPSRPESGLAALIEAELLRLSVVAFAMFNRNRLWATQGELDDDLAGLGLAGARGAATPAFRAPLTPGEEMVGRFFFIQRAQAVQDSKTLQTYEFLHATFGEYLVARLTVQAMREAAARDAASTLAIRLGPEPEDDLVQALLGFQALSTRPTVLTFVAGLLTDEERPALREWLVGRTRQAVIEPTWTARRYRPVDRRVDHWMATYSFNLVLLLLTFGRPIRAGEIWTATADPAYWLQSTALQWRAAIPGTMWMEAVERLTVRREWHNDRRDIVLSAGPSTGYRVDGRWSNRMRPHSERGPRFAADFALGSALPSMHLSNNLSDDVMLHAVEPLLDRLPLAVTGFVVDEDGRTESEAHRLIRLVTESAYTDDPARLLELYRGATAAFFPVGSDIVLRCLVADARRLPPNEVVHLVDHLLAGGFSDGPGAHAAIEVLSAVRAREMFDEPAEEPSGLRSAVRSDESIELQVAVLGDLLAKSVTTIRPALLARAIRALAELLDDESLDSFLRGHRLLSRLRRRPDLTAIDPETLALIERSASRPTE